MSKIEKQCEVCKSNYTTRRDTSRFCSKKCHGEYKSIFLIGNKNYNWKGVSIEQVCLFCKKVFKRPIKQIFCSRECTGKYKSVFLVGENSPGYKFDMVMNTCVTCNKELTRKQTKNRQKFCSRECYYKNQSKVLTGVKQPHYLGENNPNFGNHCLQGKNNPNWKNGLSNLPYAIEFNEELKAKIRKRDNYICQNKECNMIEEEHLICYGFNLSIHHIDYNKMNSDEKNLIVLCFQFNGRANSNRDYWMSKF